MAFVYSNKNSQIVFIVKPSTKKVSALYYQRTKCDSLWTLADTIA